MLPSAPPMMPPAPGTIKLPTTGSAILTAVDRALFHHDISSLLLHRRRAAIDSDKAIVDASQQLTLPSSGNGRCRRSGQDGSSKTDTTVPDLPWPPRSFSVTVRGERAG